MPEEARGTPLALSTLDGTKNETVLRVGPLEIDLPRHQVKLRGELVRLTPIEHRLLVLLASNPGRVLTHRQILQSVWGPAATTQTHYLRVYMTHLRRKLEHDPARPQLLLNEPGVGYRMRDPEEGRES